MTTSFIDKWNYSVAFVTNNYKEYLRYIEDVLIGLFENDEFVITNLAGFALKQESETVFHIIAILKESIPEEFEENVYENTKYLLQETMEENRISSDLTFVYVYNFNMGKDYLNGRLQYGISAVIK